MTILSLLYNLIEIWFQERWDVSITVNLPQIFFQMSKSQLLREKMSFKKLFAQEN